MRSWFAFFAVGVMALGCGSNSGSGLNGYGYGGQAGGGYGGNVGAQGCTTKPDCNACQGCFATCICTTGSSQNACANACGLPINTGGSGNTGNTGGSGNTGNTGGSGNTSNTGGSGNTGNTGGSGNTGNTGGSGNTGGGGGSTTKGPLAGGISISQIVINQAVAIPIERNGQAVSNRNAPVVQGRQALMRVYVTPGSGFSARTIVGRLSVSGAADQTDSKNISGTSSDGSLGSTFDFTIPAGQMTGNTQFSVELEEASGSTKGTPSGARYPGSGTASMSAKSANGPFKVVAVPVVMNGITPNTSQAHMQALHDALMKMYPASGVNVTLHGAMNYPYGSVSASGSGWSQALQWAMGLRSSLGIDSKTFIYGMLAPANSMQSFCGGGCVAGLGTVPQPSDVSGRASVGLAYFPDGSGGPTSYSGGAPDTMAHELGHALGRNHANCSQGGQISGVDPSYPYQQGSIGVWGYDLSSKGLKNPSQYKDFMGYCFPNWISDYTYAGIFSRESYVNANGYVIQNPDPLRAPGRFRVAIIEPDGTMHWTGDQDTLQPMFGEEREVQELDSAGNVVGTVVGFYKSVTDLAGGILYVRESSVSTAAGIHAISAPTLSPTVLKL